MEEVVEPKTLENYELMLIILSDLGEEGINKELDELKKHITSDGGEVFNEDTWGNREMSYRIKKQDQGYYCVLNFKVGPDHIAEMQRNLTISPAVIRFLLTKTPVNYVYKTFEEYKVLADKEKEIKDAAKREEDAKKERRMAQPRGTSKHSKPSGETQKSEDEEKARKPKVEKKIPVKAEIKEETTKIEEEVKPRKAAIKLEEVDAKLKSIIDDPDITL